MSGVIYAWVLVAAPELALVETSNLLRWLELSGSVSRLEATHILTGQIVGWIQRYTSLAMLGNITAEGVHHL